MMREKATTVSVIVPTLQEEDYIATTLSSLKKLKTAIEIIVVDGGSRDKTVEIAKRFTDKVHQIKERGISRAKNFGAHSANGQFLVFLDADVTFHSDFVKKVLETFEDPSVVGATCNVMPSESSIAETAFFHFYNLLIRTASKLKPLSRGEFFAIRKSAFMRVKGFDENIPCVEDHELANRLSRLGKFVFISDLTVYESLRRFHKLGLLRVVGTWLMDYLSFVFRGKPQSKVWQPVR